MYVDILNASNVKQGPGPITMAIRWRWTQKLSAAGDWQLSAPATDPRLEYATLKRQLHAYHWIGNQRYWIGGGTLEKRQVAMRGDNETTMSLSGNDVLFELARATVNIEINYDSPYIGAAMFDQIMSNAPAGWTVTVEGATPNLIARFADESVLNALVTICNKTGQMFRLDPELLFDGSINFRRLKIFSTINDSGLLATNRTAPLAIERNVNACLIEDIDRLEDAGRLINRAIPYGAGTGQSRFTPYAATLWPDGSAIATPYEIADFAGREHRFSFDAGTRIIADLTSIGEYGAYTSQVQFKEIAPIEDTTPDYIAASNALIAATVQWLLDVSQPQDHYSLNVVGLRKVVYPGQSIRVVAKQYREGRAPIDIDQDLIIQEVVNEVDVNGLRPVALTVATTREFAMTDAQIVAREIQKALVYQSHPQTGPSENTFSYRDEIDDDFGADFPFWFSKGTTNINSVTARFTVGKLRSTVKSVGGTATGSATLPQHTHGITVAAHDHEITIESDAASHGFARLLYFDPTDDTFYLDTVGAGPTGVGTTAGGGGISQSSGNNAADVPISLSLANAISTVYGIYEDPATAYTVNDLSWAINGVPYTGIVAALGGGWYELAITNYIIDPLTLRPSTLNNVLSVAIPVTQQAKKRARINVQIELRSNIQSLRVV